MLADPTSLAAAGNHAWLVSNSGTTFSHATGGNTWSALPGMSLSVVAAGSVIAGIDGAPNDGSQINASHGQSFLVKTYNADNNAWANISTFPAAQIATDGTSIWAISQVTSDRQAYKYDGSGTSWTAVGAMPNSDAPAAIVATGGKLAAIANNGRGLWINGGSGWQQIGTATYSTITANGGKVGLIDDSGNGWVLSTANNNALTASMTGISNVAQAPNGDQYVTDGTLNLWHVVFPQGGGSPTSTQLRSNAVGVTVSDGGTVYALDNTGNIWVLINPANNSWQQLPDLPGT
jgi:hypothetical protein